MTQRPSDDDLMRAIRRGSRDAFRDLMARWQRPVARFLRLVGMDASEVEDGVQEVFLRVFSYRHRYRPTGSAFRAFLFRVSRNVAVDFARKARNARKDGQGNHRRVVPLETEPAQEHRVPLWNDRFDCEWAVASLSERHRVAIVLNVYGGLSYREIAEALEIPLGTVKSRMYYAFRELREKLYVEAAP